MTEEDWDRHASCPACGYKTVVTVQADVQNKTAFAKVDYPCIQCGTPLALLEGKGEEEPDTPVEVDTGGGVIDILALVKVAVADVQEKTTGGATLSAEGLAVVDSTVRSVVEALEGLQVLSKGAVDK